MFGPTRGKGSRTVALPLMIADCSVEVDVTPFS